MRQMHVIEEVHEDMYIRHLAIFVSFMQFLIIMVMDVSGDTVNIFFRESS